MIYSLISRGQTVLVDHTSFSGNFTTVSLDVTIC